MSKPNIAILGATGVVGREITQIVDELGIEFESIKFLSRPKSAGTKLTFQGKDYTVEDIRRWHKKQGWKDIGYHYVIYRDGSVHPGRPLQQIGAHTTGHNSYSIGICYIGGCAKDGRTPKDTRTPEQKLAMYKLLYDLLETYPKATVHGHYEFANKACPSFKMEDLQKEYHLWLTITKLTPKCNFK
jgi:N-acetylmuramoyl-L-alanine amidase